MRYVLLSILLVACGRGPAGAPGQPGPAGASAVASEYSIVEVVDPCGDAAGIEDEVLLRLSNGEVLASYTSGKDTRFALLSPGTYVTTDGSRCVFTVEASGEVVW